MVERFAVYYAPSASDPLWERAATWLGRDALSNSLIDGTVAGIARDRLLNLTQSANRYGFHATLKPPMALAPDTTPEDLRMALAAFVADWSPVPLGRLQLASLDGFLALVPAGPNEALQDFAAAVVETFEPFRAPLSLKERARRSANLSPRQLELLDAYGYPYVFDEFRFHMTLTDRLSEADHADMWAAAQTWFGPVLDTEFVLDRLVLYHEPESGRAFRRLEDYRLSS